MKKLLYLLVFTCGVSFAASNPEIGLKDNNPEVGDVLKINTPKNLAFKHIEFPNLNIIAKRGGQPNYKSVYGELVIVKKVVDKHGDTHVVLARKDGKKFFGFQKYVSAHYNNSIEAGEIVKVQ
ncbi:hypothetical protein ACFQ0I_10040 [Mariniflexile aquimaris]|uniref:Uncharacterized protein n=1 Tax=Mariniflexile aquimaris TaxID=881009 RepID=A0ABW3BU54_9FLAO